MRLFNKPHEFLNATAEVSPEDLHIFYKHELEQEIIPGPTYCGILLKISKAYQHKVHDGWTINVQDMHMWCEKNGPKHIDEPCELFFKLQKRNISSCKRLGLF